MQHDEPRSITEVFRAAKSGDRFLAALAYRELLERHGECADYVPKLLQLLGDSNPARACIVFWTFVRIGQSTVPALIEALDHSCGDYRLRLISLIVRLGRFEDFLPVVKQEIEIGAEECRYWAANCLGLQYHEDSDWPDDAHALLDECMKILESLRNRPKYWAQARMTLSHLGQLPELDG